MTLTGTNNTIYRPYGVAQFTATTTSTYWDNKLINIQDGGNNIGYAPVNGNKATFSLDSKSLSTGTHNIRTEYPQDYAYNEMFSNTLTYVIDKTTLPITLTRNSSTVLRPSTVTLTIGSTASYYTPEVVQIYDNGQPWFTATYTGTSITLTTSSSYFSTGSHILQAGIAEDFNYHAVQSSTSSIFIDKDRIPLTIDTGASSIVRPSTITFLINSPRSFNVPKIINILDNGFHWVTATFTGTNLILTTSSSYVNLGTNNFEVLFSEDNDYYSSSNSISTYIDKYQPGSINLIGPQTISITTWQGVEIDINSPILRPNPVLVTATTADPFFNGKSITAVYNNTNIGSAIFNGFTATFNIPSTLLGIGQAILEYAPKPGDPPIDNNPYTTQGGTSTFNVVFTETNDSYSVFSNNFSVFTALGTGPAVYIQGPKSLSTLTSTYVAGNPVISYLYNNPFNRNFTTGTTLTFTATTTGSYWANKAINFYVATPYGNNLITSTNLIGYTATVSVQTTSSVFYEGNNFVYAEIPQDNIYTTSTCYALGFTSTNTLNSYPVYGPRSYGGLAGGGWLIGMESIQLYGRGHNGYNSDYGLVITASTSSISTSGSVTYTISVNDQYPNTPFSMLTALQGQTIQLWDVSGATHRYSDYASTFTGSSISITVPGSQLYQYGSSAISAECLLYPNVNPYYNYMASNTLQTIITP